MDVQKDIPDHVRNKGEIAGLSDRIQFHQSLSDRLNLHKQAGLRIVQRLKILFNRAALPDRG